MPSWFLKSNSACSNPSPPHIDPTPYNNSLKQSPLVAECLLPDPSRLGPKRPAQSRDGPEARAAGSQEAGRYNPGCWFSLQRTPVCGSLIAVVVSSSAAAAAAAGEGGGGRREAARGGGGGSGGGVLRERLGSGLNCLRLREFSWMIDIRGFNSLGKRTGGNSGCVLS